MSSNQLVRALALSCHPSPRWRSLLHRLTRPTSAPFRVRALTPVSGRLSGATSRGPITTPRFPAAFQPPAFASWAVLRPLGISTFLTVGLPDRNRQPGPQRGYHVPLVRDMTGQGAPSTPGTAVFSRPDKCLRSPPAASQRPVPAPRPYNPSPKAHSDEASSGVNLRSPVGLLLTCGPRMDRAPSGLNPELRTPPLPATHVRAETSLEH